MKNDIKRDKKGRFAKKCDCARSHEGVGMSTKEYIKQLEAERDCFKRLSENVTGMYLNKCAEIKGLKHELCSCEKACDKLMKAAKYYKRRSRTLYEISALGLDAICEAARNISWLLDSLPWYKKLFNRDKILEGSKRFNDLLERIDSIDVE